jgi:hypothetical protein
MAANNKIQIQVEVAGATKAANEIKKIEVSSSDLKEGVKGVGENFKAVSETVSASNERMGLGVSAVGESILGLTEAFTAFQASAGAGLMGMLGPISLLVGALGLAYEAFRQFSGAAREAQIWEEVMSATASDLTSRMEMLAEQGVKLTTAELKEFIKVNQAARIALETINSRNEDLLKTYKKHSDALKEVEDAQKELNEVDKDAIELGSAKDKTVLQQIASLPKLVALLWEVDSATEAQTSSTQKLIAAKAKLETAEKDMAAEYEKTLPMLQASLRMENALSKDQAGLLADLRAAIYAKADADIAALEAQNKHSEALKVYKTATEQANLETQKRIRYIENVNQRVKDGYITQEQANDLLRENKFDTYDLTQGYVKQTDALTRSNETILRGAEARDKAREVYEKSHAREMELLQIKQEAEKTILDDYYERIFKTNDQEKRLADDRRAKYVRDLLELIRGVNDVELVQKESQEMILNSAENFLNRRKSIYQNYYEELNQQEEEAIAAGLATHEFQISGMTEIFNMQDRLMQAYEAESKQYVDLMLSQVEADIKRRKALADKEAESIFDRKIKQATIAKNEALFNVELKKLNDQRIVFIEKELLYIAQSSASKKAIDLENQRNILATQEIERKSLDARKMAMFDYEEGLLQTSQLYDIDKLMRKTELNKDLLQKDKEFITSQYDLNVKSLDASIELQKEQLAIAEYYNDQALSKQSTAELEKLKIQKDTLKIEQDQKLVSLEIQDKALFLQMNNQRKLLDAQRDAIKGFYEDLNEDSLIGFMDKLTTSVVGIEESRRRSLAKQNAEDLQAAIDRENIAAKRLETEIQLRNNISLRLDDEARALDNEQEAQDIRLRHLEHLQEMQSYNVWNNNLTAQELETLNFVVDEIQAEVNAFEIRDQQLIKNREELNYELQALDKDLALSRKEAIRLEIEQQRVQGEKIAEQWASIGDAITGSISGATQSMMNDIATLIYDDSADQKRKDLNKARKAELKAFKGTMQERMEIEKKYAEEKKALDAEEANRLPNILKATLRNLAIEATGKALFEGAAALASLAIRDFEGAALHGKSAAAYGIVAGVMGSATLLAGGPTNAASGGGTVAGSSTTSPTGLSQTGVNREEAKSNEPVVFNINFAGANIYDSREAALRALSNEIFRVGQQSQRGSRFIPRGV